MPEVAIIESDLNCPCENIKTSLNEKAVQGLFENAPLGTYTLANQDPLAMQFDFHMVPTDQLDDGFDLKTLTIEVTAMPLTMPFMEKIGHLSDLEHKGVTNAGDQPLLKFAGIFRMRNGAYARVNLTAKYIPVGA